MHGAPTLLRNHIRPCHHSSFPGRFVTRRIVREYALRTPRCGGKVDLGQPTAVFLQHGRLSRVAGEIDPFMRVDQMVIQFLAAIGVPNVPPAFATNRVIPLIVRGDRGPRAGCGCLTQLRAQADPLQIVTWRKPTQFDQRGIDIEQLGRLRHPATF